MSMFELDQLVPPLRLVTALIGSYGAVLTVTSVSGYILDHILERGIRGLPEKTNPFVYEFAVTYGRGGILQVANFFGFGILLAIMSILFRGVELQFEIYGFTLSTNVPFVLKMLSLWILAVGYCEIFR